MSMTYTMSLYPKHLVEAYTLVFICINLTVHGLSDPVEQPFECSMSNQLSRIIYTITRLPCDPSPRVCLHNVFCSCHCIASQTKLMIIANTITEDGSEQLSVYIKRHPIVTCRQLRFCT